MMSSLPGVRRPMRPPRLFAAFSVLLAADALPAVAGIQLAGAGGLWELPPNAPPPVVPVWLLNGLRGASPGARGDRRASAAKGALALDQQPLAPAPVALLARAPAPCAPAPPQLGAESVEQTVDERIDQDSRRISLIAQELVSVRDQFRNVEQESLSKVFDMGSMKSFFEMQKEAQERNHQLQKESARLVGQVGALTEQLNRARGQYEAQDDAYNAQEKRLRAQVAKERVEVAEKTTDLQKQKNTYQANLALTDANQALATQNSHSLEAVQVVMKKLAMAKSVLESRQNATQEVEAAVMKQREYLKHCEGDSRKITDAIGKSAAEEELEKTKAATEEKNEEQAVQKAQLANSLMGQRLGKAKANKLTIQNQIIRTTEKFAALQIHGEAELHRLRSALGEMRETLQAMETQLTINVQARQALEKEITSLEEEVKKLEEKLLSGELAAIRANNTRLKEELGRAQVHLHEAKATTEIAADRQVRASTALEHARAETERQGQEATKVARESLARVEAVKQAAVDAATRTDEAVMLAESAQIDDCDPLWDKNNPDILKEIEQCKTLPADLEAANAQVASLSSLAFAQAAAEKVDDAPTPAPAPPAEAEAELSDEEAAAGAIGS
mmetsp:Transcript_63850/g.208159  ORF Transcript_63850/g.208159 Transcript_63850/m.208159 type:complete len:618 (-) Transcript_63850:140-1993(-)